MFIQFNFSAILVCAVMNMVLGFIWYGFLFKNAFVQLMGVKSDQMSAPATQKAAVHGYFSLFVSSVLMAAVLSYFIVLSESVNVVEALKLGWLAWMGFTVTSMLPYHYFSMKPLKLALINISYPLVGLSLMSIILVYWRK